MAGLFGEIRTFFRSMVRQPGYSLVIIATLALAIGANTAIFSVAHGVLLRPLPYADADRLVALKASFSGTPPTASVAGPMLVEFRQRTEAFERLEAIWINAGSVEGENDAEQIERALATPGFLEMVGADPSRGGIGRMFVPEETVPDGASSVIISHGLWQRRFGGGDDILGDTIRVSGRERIVVGVLPESFRLVLPGTLSTGAAVDAWIPMDEAQGETLAEQNPEMLWLRVIGKLKPGVSLEQAAAEMHTIGQGLQQDYEEYAGTELDFHVYSLHGEMVVDVETGIWALLGAVAFVLLIACANVANLALARATRVEREFALRAALGSSRRRLLATTLLESVLLAVAGGALGVMLAAWGLDLLVALRPPNLPRLDQIGIDGTVLAFSLGASLLTGVLFGSVPAWKAMRANLNDTLKRGGTSVAGLGGHHGLRRGLVIAEVAMSVVLLAGAGLMMQSFLRLASVDPGFNPERLITFELSLPGSRYSFPVANEEEQPGETGAWEFLTDLTASLEALPGVQSAGAVSHLPLGGRSFTVEYWRNPDSNEPGARASAHERVVLPGYFEAMGVRLLAGRLFDETDDQNSEAIIVDRRLAEHVWPQGDAVGERLKINVGTEESWMTVVGVVDHVRHDELTAEGLDQIYLPFRRNSFGRMAFVVRTSGDPTALVPAIRREVAARDAQLPVFNVKEMEAYVADATAFVRYPLILMGVFAGVAMLLAAVGIYGTLSYLVGLRTREIGIRLAIGAGSHDVRNLVLRQGLVPTLLGLVGGVLAAVAVTRLLGSLLYQISATDPVTYVAITLMLMSVAVLACWVPSRRAVRINPTIVLRD